MNEQVINLIIVILLACACGLLSNLLRIPVLVGYILAGCLVNTFVGNMVFDGNMIQIIAEIGVILLLFVVGLELNLRKFYDVLHKGAMLALLQIVLGLLISCGINLWYNLPVNIVLALGFSIAISSTAVVLALLHQQNLLNHRIGRLMVAVVLFQDLAIAPMMVVISLNLTNIFLSLVKLSVAIVILLLVIRYIFSREHMNFHWVDKLCKQQEAMILVSISVALIAAALSFAMDLSYAYGAFLSGLVIGNSKVGEKVLHSVISIQYLTILFFFFSIGLMLDLNFVVDNLQIILICTALVIFGKFIMNFILLWILKESKMDAFKSSVIMSQVGEFSFVLINFSIGIQGYDSKYLQFVTILIAFSLMISPVIYVLQHYLRSYLRRLRHAQE